MVQVKARQPWSTHANLGRPVQVFNGEGNVRVGVRVTTGFTIRAGTVGCRRRADASSLSAA